MFRQVIIIAALVAILGGCAANSVARPTVPDTTSFAAHGRAQSWMESGSGGAPFVYVSEAECGCVLVYSASRARFVGLINAGLVNPEGITTDSNDTLYITDAAKDINGNFDIYKFPAGSLNETNIFFAPQRPSDVAVSANGTVYVSTSGAIPAIFAYANNSQVPTSQLLDEHAIAGFGIA